MEATACIKAVVTAANHYRNNKSDGNLTQLLRHLDVLISIANKGVLVKTFDPKQLLPTECLTCLVDIMNDPKTKTALAHKTMVLLNILAQGTEIRETLHSVFHLTSSLAAYLQSNAMAPPDSCTVQCVELLQRITYNCEISYQETYVEGLLKFVIKNMQGNETVLTQPCLGLFANLCRHSFSIQNHVKNLDNCRAIYKTLVPLISHKNLNVVVFAMSIWASLCLHDEYLGDKLFHARNIHQTFQMIFNIVLNGDVNIARQYGVDLFIDLLKYPKIQNSLVIFTHLELSVAQVLGKLSATEPGPVCKLLELLVSFCSVHELRSVVCKCLLDTSSQPMIPVNTSTPAQKRGSLRKDKGDPFSTLVHWASQSVEMADNTSLLALQLMKEVYEELLDSGLSSHLSPRTNLALPMLTEVLMSTSHRDGATLNKKYQKTVKALRVMNVLCINDITKTQVAESVDTKTMISLLDQQFNHNRIALNFHRSHVDLDDWSESGADVVIYSLDLMLRIKRYVANMENEFVRTLQDSRCVPFLAFGMTSDEKERVNTALRLVGVGASVEGFPAIILGDSIASYNSKRKAVPRQDTPQPNSYQPTHTRQSANSVSSVDKENVFRNVNGSKRRHTESRDSMDASIQGLIDRMNTGMELKDARASEIIDVYKHKLQSLQTKENHLQDLLEAKALALSQADRLISQYRCRLANADAEAHKFSSLLQESEKRIEENREEINEMLLDRERLQENLEQAVQENKRLGVIAAEHQELTETYNEQAKRLENTQRSLATLKQEHQSMSEMHEMLRRHNDTLKQQYDAASKQLSELEDERKNQSKLLKEKEVKLQDLTKMNNKYETDIQKLRKESEELEEAIDKFRNELAKTEQIKKELQHQVSSLEVVCRQHETDIREKDIIIQNQKGEIEKNQKIATLINSLTSGKTPTDLNL